MSPSGTTDQLGRDAYVTVEMHELVVGLSSDEVVVAGSGRRWQVNLVGADA